MRHYFVCILIGTVCTILIGLSVHLTHRDKVKSVVVNAGGRHVPQEHYRYVSNSNKPITSSQLYVWEAERNLENAKLKNKQVGKYRSTSTTYLFNRLRSAQKSLK